MLKKLTKSSKILTKTSKIKNSKTEFYRQKYWQKCFHVNRKHIQYCSKVLEQDNEVKHFFTPPLRQIK